MPFKEEEEGRQKGDHLVKKEPTNTSSFQKGTFV